MSGNMLGDVSLCVVMGKAQLLGVAELQVGFSDYFRFPGVQHFESIPDLPLGFLIRSVRRWIELTFGGGGEAAFD